MKYFHELTDEEFEALKNTDITWDEVARRHPQPEWCNYPGALLGELGCWSLVYRIGPVSLEYCSTCELFNAPNNGVQLTPPVAKRNSRSATSRKSSTVRGFMPT